MKISSIGPSQSFKSNQVEQGNKKREIIDVILDGVKNPRDVNDCVAVPRGIFKAYIALMAGTGLIAIGGLLPKKADAFKRGINIVGWGLNILSAYYFAKPFAFKGILPTISRQSSK